MTIKTVALVTGGARGIGLACARAIRETHGVELPVMLADIDGDGAKTAAAELGDNCHGFACDVADTGQIDSLFDEIESRQGTVGILVNNAGIAMPTDFLDVTIDDFRKVIDINLTGSFYTTQRAARKMVADEVAGSIVNMSSINAQVAIPSIVSYCASKGGVMQLTKSAALALAPHNIRVNAVGPGSIDTAMLASVNANPDAMKMVMSRTPLGRLGDAREIGDVVAFLSSDKASYITGETIYVDGGRLGMNYTC